MDVMPKYVEHPRSSRIGLLLVLATGIHGVAVHAQGVGNANDSTPAAARVGSSPIGSGGGSPATVSRGGTANNLSGRAATTTQRATGRSFNRVTTARPDVVSTSSRTARPGGTSVASGRMAQDDSLHPYSDQMRLAQAGRSNSEIPSSSSWRPESRPESQPVMSRSAPHNYYPTMRTGQYPNANTAPITRGRTGAPHICVPNRAGALAGAARGR